MSDDGAATFKVSAAVYDRHIGRYGAELADGLIELAGLAPADRALDVGCGTGLLTAAMARVVRPGRVAAVDPAPSFVQACRARVPVADVLAARAEQLPFHDATFDRVLSQLVVNFLSDPLAGVQQMRRVTRSGGTVAGCVWDYSDAMTLLRAFWDAATALDPAASELDEGNSMRHCRPDSLQALGEAADLQDVEVAALQSTVSYASFDELWAPFTTGVAPSGAYAARLDDAHQQALRHELFVRLGQPNGPFSLAARAWAVAGRR